MELLMYFALPLATILLAIVLDRYLGSPTYVTVFLFSIYLIGIFIMYATGIITNLGNAMVALIIYTLLAYFTSYISCICSRIETENDVLKNKIVQFDNFISNENSKNETYSRDSKLNCQNNEENSMSNNYIDIDENLINNQKKINIMNKSRCWRRY